MGSFLLFVASGVLSFLMWTIIISVVLSWLVAFDVINLRNRAAYSIVRALEAITRPILRPVQKIIPNLGGVDISPVIVILLIQGAQRYLLPLIFSPLIARFG
jgi:YggT family protein